MYKNRNSRESPSQQIDREQEIHACLESAVPGLAEIIRTAETFEKATDVADKFFRRFESLVERLEKLEANLDKKEFRANYPASPNQGLILAKEVVKLTGLSRTTIYRLIKRNEFPPDFYVGTQYRRWCYCDIEEWLANRPEIKRK
jgi:prophage regulatory protein